MGPFHHLWVDRVEEEMVHFMLSLSWAENLVFQTVAGASLVVGNLFRFLLFKQVWTNGRFVKAINIMTGIFCTCIFQPGIARYCFKFQAPLEGLHKQAKPSRLKLDQ